MRAKKVTRGASDEAAGDALSAPGAAQAGRGEATSRPPLTPRGVEEFTVGEAQAAAIESKATAVADIIGGPHAVDRRRARRLAAGDRRRRLAGRCRGPAAGAARQVAARAPQRSRARTRSCRPTGGRRLSLPEPDVAKAYGRQKYGLQVELLKLQAWVKVHRTKIVVLFEGAATRPARAAPSSASWST